MADLTRVPPPDPADWLERFWITPEQIARERWYAKLAVMAADTVEAAADGTIDDNDLHTFIADMKLSRQDIAGILQYLEQVTARAVRRRDDTAKYLRALKVEQIWTPDLDESRLPRPGFTIEVLKEDGTIEVIEP